MTNWTETYRGTVPAWQCDTTEHFTVAFYFDRLEEAETTLAEGFDVANLAGHPRSLNVRLVRELRAGTCFHVESAALGVDDGLRLGHRFVDSTSGETVTWIDARWDPGSAPLPAARRDAIGARLAAWNGPEIEKRPEPVSTAGFMPTARGRVKPGDLDAAGCFSLSAMVHRFSNASGQVAAAVGMDPGLMQQRRRGFSTFEMGLRLSGALRLNEPYLIETGIGHLGNSSLRMIHRMTNAHSGAEIARLGQFGVNLDLDARRPARWDEDIRARAAALVVAVE